jgi:hypothetical protein
MQHRLNPIKTFRVGELNTGRELIRTFKNYKSIIQEMPSVPF